MVFILARCTKDFQHEDMKIGNIHPENVLLGGQQANDVRVVTRFTRPAEPIGVEKVLEDGRGSYISP
jgi:hypothetical protein